jgi:hypothetical protein
MPRPTELPPEASRVLALARHARSAAKAALGALDVGAQVQLVCETPLGRRAELLELLPAPERVVPALPEAELCFTAKAIGLADSGWLLEHATFDQLQTSIDLDAWKGLHPDRRQLAAWLAAVAEASDDKLVETIQGIDLELVVLWVRDSARVVMKASGDDWEPPTGAMTLEGQFFLVAKADDDELEFLMRCLRAIFERDYWLYFRIVQGAIEELDADCEEFALRWRTARLADFGFPSFDESIRIYGRVRERELTRVPDEASALEATTESLPAETASLPVPIDSAHLLFRAAGELDADERRVFFHRFVTLANQVAVADRLPLGDAESIPSAIEKAASVASRALEHVARQNGLSPVEVLRRLPLERLFRVGASLDPAARRQLASEP